MSERQNARELISVHQGNLYRLEEQVAKYGMHVPLDILNAIDHTKSEISKLDAILADYDNMSIDVPSIEVIQRIDNVNDDINRIDSQLASYTATTNTVSNHYELSEYNIKLTEEYIKAIERFQTNTITIMDTEISILREQNVNLSKVVENLQQEISRIRDVIAPKNFLDGKDDIEEELRHQQAIRKEVRKRLRVLEMEQAKKGINTPPEVETQIIDLRERITEIEASIKILSFELDKFLASSNAG